MRIIVSGTHASGKSTLISDFALRRPDFTVLGDPFDLIDESWDGQGAAMFAAQLRAAADRMGSDEFTANVIAERGPIDFLAYLLAIDELGRAPASPEVVEWATLIAAETLDRVDLLVVLPLTGRDAIRVGADEDPELRSAMNDILMELVDDPDIVGTHPAVVEIVGDPGERLLRLEALVQHDGEGQ